MRDAEAGGRDIGNQARQTKGGAQKLSLSPRLLGAALTPYSVQKPRERKAGGPALRATPLTAAEGSRSYLLRWGATWVVLDIWLDRRHLVHHHVIVCPLDRSLDLRRFVAGADDEAVVL